MTDTYVVVREPDGTEKKIRNVSTVVGANTVLHQVTLSAKEDGTIIPPASETKQDTGNASLSSIDGKTPALGQALAAASVPVVLTAAQVTTLTPPAAITGFSTAAKQPALGTAGVASTDVITVQGIASGVAQPVSAASLPLPSGAATLAEQQSQTTVQGATSDAAVTTDTTGSLSGKLRGLIKWAFERMPASLGQKAMSASLPVVIASDQATFPVTATLSGTVKTSLSASSAVTISLASLASDTNLLAGQESDAIDNTTTRALDYLLAGKIRQGTSPTTAKEIRVYVVGTLNDTPTWPDVFDGTGSAETVTSSGIRDSVCRLAAVMATDSTSDRDNYFGPVSVAALFGGVLPLKFIIFVTHNTAVALNSTGGNHVLSITPVFQTIS